MLPFNIFTEDLECGDFSDFFGEVEAEEDYFSNAQAQETLENEAETSDEQPPVAVPVALPETDEETEPAYALPSEVTKARVQWKRGANPKGILFTLSQVGVGGGPETKEMFHTILRNFFVSKRFDVPHQVTCEELHADGGRHYHSYMEVQHVNESQGFHMANLKAAIGKQYNCRLFGTKELDRVQGYLYCTKGMNFLEYVDGEAGRRRRELPLLKRKKKDSEEDKVAKGVIAGILIDAPSLGYREVVKRILHQFPERAGNAKRYKEAAMVIEDCLPLDDVKKPWRGLEVADDVMMTTFQRRAAETIVNWFNTRVRQVNAPIRAPQLLVVGPGRIGKSTFGTELASYLNVYVPPRNAQWFPHYEPSKTDLMFFDEAAGAMAHADLLSLLDGQTKILDVKGHSVVKRFANNHAIAMFSNFMPATWYKQYYEQHPDVAANLHDVDAPYGTQGRGRLIVVKLEQGFNFQTMIKFSASLEELVPVQV